ncbi:beta-lactamase [Nocardia seriolae]|uniref:Beta-lactamase n=1 Tax=Nocardia seriolae TaxID=37332 RepID=A0ABC9Z8B2_9NOCA|nr:hypothetical protein NS07_v2contig00239-0001 [Nocardia seriolae]GAP33323.1 beta-lactamase [Nocardia seriolae]
MVSDPVRMRGVSVGEPQDLAGLIEARMRIDRVPGLSVAVARQDRVVYSRGFGLADLGSGLAATARTAYLWFSMTKVVTATAIMQLADQHRLDLDGPVDELFAPFAVVRQPRPITVRQLLSHSSGLANPIPIRWVTPATASVPNSRDFVTHQLKTHARLRFPPGQRSAYSNLGYLVLGDVIAQVTGLSYENYVRTHILTPLNMTHTGFTYDEVGDRTPAVGYQPLPRGLRPLLRAYLPPGIVGDRHGRLVGYRPFYVTGRAYGGLIGDVEDAIRLARLHLGEGALDGVWILSPESAAAMRRTTSRGGDRDFGLGWFRPHPGPQGPTEFVEHLGGGSGFWNVVRIYSQADLAIALMGNITGYDHNSIIDAITATSW